MDLHMMFPILEFVDEKKLESFENVARARLQLLQPTNMIDYALDIMQKLDGDGKNNIEEMEKLENSKKEIFDKLAEFKKESFETVTPANKQKCEEAAHFFYNCGDYQTARSLIAKLMDISNNIELKWGCLACDLLLQNYEDAVTSFLRLKSEVDNNSSPIDKLYLIHWALFLLPHIVKQQQEVSSLSKDLQQVMEVFCNDRYVSLITSKAPYLLPYIVSLFVTVPQFAMGAHRVGKLITAAGSDNDSLLKFFKALTVDFDFELASDCLLQLEDLISKDFFLAKIKDQLMEDLRCVFFDYYCRVTSKFAIQEMSEKLGFLDLESTEQWIVDLILRSKYKGKIEKTVDGNAVFELCQFVNSDDQTYEVVLDQMKNDWNIRSSHLVQNFRNFQAQRAATIAAAREEELGGNEMKDGL